MEAFLKKYSLRPIISDTFVKQNCPKVTGSFHFYAILITLFLLYTIINTNSSLPIQINIFHSAFMIMVNAPILDRVHLLWDKGSKPFPGLTFKYLSIL